MRGLSLLAFLLLPAGVGALQLSIVAGVLLSFALGFVYREQLKDLSFTPKAPFDFAIQNNGKTVFTEQGKPKVIRFVAGDDGDRKSTRLNSSH